ncbi:hypothetical protein F5880DRAFT_1606874 [Lentinula raphanica]|nr:hypothetical protein F5880DRAFT_1606874 [Lentinula raphanica]
MFNLLSSFVLGLVLVARAAPARAPAQEDIVQILFETPPAPGFPLPKVDSRPGSRPGTPGTGSRSGSHPGTPVPTVEVDVDVDYEIHIIVKKWRESLMKHGNFRLNYLKSYTDDISENLHDFWFWGDGVGEMCRTQEDFCTFEFTPVEAREDPEEPDLSLGSFTRT